jgi:hypothetical protein
MQSVSAGKNIDASIPENNKDRMLRSTQKRYRIWMNNSLKSVHDFVANGHFPSSAAFVVSELDAEATCKRTIKQLR